MIRFLLLFLYILSSSVYAQSTSKASQLDSILILRAQSKDSDLSMSQRLDYAKQAVALSFETGRDSTVLKSRKNLSLLHFENEDYEQYNTTNIGTLKLALQSKDSITMASTYHNIGWYHHYEAKNDSAFYYYSRAIKLYKKLKNVRQEAIILLNIADIQETEKDYIGSEENAVTAIKLLNTLPKSEAILDDLWILNNLLGVISLKLKSYDKSLEYHQKAFEISEAMKFGYFNKLYSINNQAEVYRRLRNIEKSIALYSDVINQDNLKREDPSFYALTLANLAYAKSLKEQRNFDEIEQTFLEAYQISDSLNDPITTLGVIIDFSRFYLDHDKKELALTYAEKSYKLSRETSSNDIRLESLLLLSKLKSGDLANQYLKEHIRLSDSLLNVERAVRNKFARITLETDELEAENERINQQKIWLFIISVVLLVTLFLLYIIITQRAKNKELKFKQDQQEANEEIYNLMLSQQDKVDEARAGEKKRISEELHDGILGRLFGTRLSLDSYNFNEGKEAIQNRSKYISELKVIEEDIRKISHDLNTDFVSGSGFMDILTELIEKQTQAYQLKYDFDYTDDINWELVPNKTKINIYRIIQEALQNIYKHADANTVKISIQLKNDVICLSIADDGKGFDTSRSKKGIGHKNISSRIEELLGTVDFDSELNKGTTIRIEIPYSNN